MLTLITLLPSDNKLILLGKEYRSHIEIYPPIENSSNCINSQFRLII